MGEIINNVDMDNSVIDQSFNDQKSKIKPLNHSFKKNLKTDIITEDDIKEEKTCAICQEQFSLGDKYVILPCEETPHFFHIGDSEKCDGLFPWIENNNTCPLCRHEFPHEPEPEPEPEPENRRLPESLIPSEITDLTPEQISGLNMGENEPRPFNPEINIEIQYDINSNNIGGNTIPSILERMIEDIYIQREEEELNATILRSIEEM